MVRIDPRFVTSFPHELSGGMKQRVNLALALALEPRFVLLDEPTTGLDVVVQHEILENVRALQQDKGFAVLFISHDIGTVLDLSDRILVMYAGELVEEQAPPTSCGSPCTRTPRVCSGPTATRGPRPSGSPTCPGRPPDLSRPSVGLPVRPAVPGEDRPLPHRRPAADR